MALTKDKLITHLQTQMGISMQESQQKVEGLLEIMKDTLAQGDELLISGFGKFSVRQKKSGGGEILKPLKVWFSPLARFWCLRPPAYCGSG